MNQKLLTISSIIFGLAILIFALWSAFDQGEKSPIFAGGRVYLDKSLEADAQNLRTLFLVLHDPQSNRPMPFGAFKEVLTAAPNAGDGGFYNFVLTRDNLQTMGDLGSNIPTSFNIKARLDQDGQGGPGQPGDLVGEITNFSTGSTNLDLRITSKLR